MTSRHSTGTSPGGGSTSQPYTTCTASEAACAGFRAAGRWRVTRCAAKRSVAVRPARAGCSWRAAGDPVPDAPGREHDVSLAEGRGARERGAQFRQRSIVRLDAPLMSQAHDEAVALPEQQGQQFVAVALAVHQVEGGRRGIRTGCAPPPRPSAQRDSPSPDRRKRA